MHTHVMMSREDLWCANSVYPERYIKIKDLTDKHVANIINWIKNGVDDGCKPHYPPYMLEFFLTEAKIRGLSKKFLNKAPYKFKLKKGQETIYKCKYNK